jgi:ABC-type spermidine/putrescine transport system permease subunit II
MEEKDLPPCVLATVKKELAKGDAKDQDVESILKEVYHMGAAMSLFMPVTIALLWSLNMVWTGGCSRITHFRTRQFWKLFEMR